MSGPHTITFVIGSLDVGGTERHLVAIARSLDRSRWLPNIYTLTRKGRLASELEAAGLNVHEPPQCAWFAKAGVLGRAARLLVVVASLVVHLARTRPRIVHCFLPASYLIGAPAAMLTLRPVRIMSRRSLNDYQRKRPFLAVLERVLHRSLTAVLGNSRAIMHQLEQEGVPPQRLRLIYNGIDGESNRAQASREEIRARLGIPANALVIAKVANLIPYKGHRDLLAALDQACGGLPQSWRLLCAGRDDGIGAGLRADASARGLSDHVLWLGERRDIGDIYAAADIGVLCSHEEGFSNAVLEGMAAGLPMVVTDVGGNAEAVVDGECGLVVAPRDPTALAAALRRLASEPALRRSFGMAARLRVQKEFSSERCVWEYDRLYDALVRGIRPLPGLGGLSGEVPSGSLSTSAE